MALKIDPSAIAPGAAKSATQAPAATDFRQFTALRRGAEANDPKALREVARQFESIFTKMMLKSMREASFGDPLFGSDQVNQYQDMMDDQMSVQLSQGKGLGLADMLIRQLSHGAGGVAGVPTSSDKQSTPSSSTAAVTPEQQRKFVDEVLPHATAAAQQLGVDVRAIVAQAALETGWGTSQPADASGTSHNLFGIKAGDQWQGASVSSNTTEYADGTAHGERDQFRAYGSIAENLADYVHVLRDNPRYSAALGTGSDVNAFANALQQGGYATDPKYAEKLVAIANSLGNTLAQRQTAAADVNPFKSSADAPITTPRMSNG